MRFPSLLCLLAYNICKRIGKPCSIEVCGSAYDSYRHYGNIIGWITAPITEWLHKHAIKDAESVLYVTKYALQKEYPANSKASTVYCSNVALPSLIKKEILIQRISKIESYHNHEYVIGQIGNVEIFYKGYKVIFKALQILKSMGYVVLYKVVGGGNPEKMIRLAKQIGIIDQIQIQGKINHDDIPCFMQEIDIYVHPSLLEGLPRSVVEAISNGVPCLVSDAGGTSELVSAQWVHKAGDYKKLADDILKMINNPDMMIYAAKENFEKAKDYYPTSLNKRRDKFYDTFFSRL